MKAISKEEREALAEKCNTSYQHLLNIAYAAGNKKASLELSLLIDEHTEGEVSCEELRPDLQPRWDYCQYKYMHAQNSLVAAVGTA